MINDSNALLGTYTETQILVDQRGIIADISRGVPIDDILRRIALYAEQHAPGGMAVNIMIYDPHTDTLNSSGGQPSIADSFLEAVRGLKPGPKMGSCGTAAYLREQVITTHIVGHELWAGFEPLMNSHGYYSSWSTPILTQEGDLLGTFGMYYPDERAPSDEDFALIDHFVYLAALAIQRHNSDLTLRKQARHDWLTGFLNRRALIDVTDRAIAGAPDPSNIGMLLIKIEDYQHILAGYGYRIADGVLRHLAEQLRAVIPTEHELARPSGESFAVLLAIDDPERLSDVALAVAATIRAPFQVDDREFRLTAAIGMAVAEQGSDAEMLFAHATLACTEAHHRGRHMITRYEPALTERVGKQNQLISRLRNAIEREQITVAYQSIVDLESRRIVGAEALARWAEEPPSVFIPIAEHAGLIHDLDMLVLRRALEETKPWIDAHADFVLHVNLSPEQLRRHDLAQEIVSTLERYGVSRDNLVLELTEEAHLGGTMGIAMMQTLRAHGLRISLDDFGTGYSSPGRLMATQYETLKIDRSFVTVLERSDTDLAMMRLMMAFGRELNLPIIAEGIETTEQRDILLHLGCRLGQGYFFDQPAPAPTFAQRFTA